MSNNLDYYATLGVLPTAEVIVIRAAYKALAQRYHPDKFNGTEEEANRRITEINEAYAILSDENKRHEYDKSCHSIIQDASSYFHEPNEDSPPAYDPLEHDWSIAINYFDNLKNIESRLSKISWRLAYSYKAYILETKTFDKRENIAKRMERQFLELYFGRNSDILAFAFELIMTGNKAAAKSLNNAARVIGDNVDPSLVISKIQSDYGLAPLNIKDSTSMYWGGSLDSNVASSIVQRNPNSPYPTSSISMVSQPPWKSEMIAAGNAAGLLG